VIIPFYRDVVGMSAYEYFGKRFGKGVRAYSSFAFAMGHFSKMGFVYYLLGLTISSMTGWNIYAVIIGVGIVTVFYTYLGGLEAVIWADVIQGFIKAIGLLICLGYLLFLPPGGPSATLAMAWDHGKISLGKLSWSLADKSFLVLSLYGLFWYLQKYTADQTLVQRYLVARTDREALKGVALGAILCIPVWALFLLVGSLLWSFYQLTGETLPARITKPDQIFPYFLSTHIPPGVAGLFMASLLAAAMSMLSSDLNCLAVVGVEDYYRMLKPNCTDVQRLRMGKLIVAFCGGLAVIIAVILAKKAGAALGLYFVVTSIVSGGLFGLFFLAFMSTRANASGAWIGIIACLAFTTYGVLTREQKSVNLGRFNFPWHPIMIGVVAHGVLVVVGYAASFCFSKTPIAPELTFWGWLAKRKTIQTPPAPSTLTRV
jgi:SSS family solute:Na+ symporter